MTDHENPDVGPTRKHEARRVLSIAIRIAFTAALLLLFLRKAEFGRVIALLRGIPPLTLLAVIAFDAAAVIVHGIKWRMLLAGIGLGRILAFGMIGRFYSFVLPGQAAGEAAKILHFGRSEGELERIASSVIVDKATGFTGLLLAGLGGLVLSRYDAPRGLTEAFGLALAGAVAFMTAMRFGAVHRLVDRTGLRRAAEAIRGYGASRALLPVQTAMGLAFQLLGMTAVHLLAEAVGIRLDFHAWCWISAAVAIALILPLTVAGLGVREGVFIGLLGAMGVDRESAIALSLSFAGLQILNALAGGACLLAISSSASPERAE